MYFILQAINTRPGIAKTRPALGSAPEAVGIRVEQSVERIQVGPLARRPQHPVLALSLRQAVVADEHSDEG